MRSMLASAMILLCICGTLAKQGISPLYGRIVTIGDSMFSCGIYSETLGALLNTTVSCNARWGARVDAVSRQPACSMDSECKWSVMNDAPGSVWKAAGWQDKFEKLVDREVAAGRKVVIHGHPVHQSMWAAEPDHGILFDKYAAIASIRQNVWFIDPRQVPIWHWDWSYYAGDKRHPSAKGQAVIAANIAKIVVSHGGLCACVVQHSLCNASCNTQVAQNIGGGCKHHLACSWMSGPSQPYHEVCWNQCGMPTTTITTTTVTTTTVTFSTIVSSIREAGGTGCLKSSGGRRVLVKSAAGDCAKFAIAGKEFRSLDVPGQCLDYFGRWGWGLWPCHGKVNQQLLHEGLKWCINSNCVELSGSSQTTSMTTTITTEETTSITTLTTTTTRMTTPTTMSTTATIMVPTTTAASVSTIQSGNIVFLKTHSGHGSHIDVENVSVHARWASHGNWQAITIEKETDGLMHSGDVVYLRTHTQAHIDVSLDSVQARWNDKGSWQAMVIEKRGGAGAILDGDVVCFRTHTSRYLTVEGGVVRATGSACGDRQSMLIEKEVSHAVFSGTCIHMLAHTGRLIEVEGTSVQARWSERGEWQKFVIENYGGRAIFSEDQVFFKAHTGALIDVQDVGVQARWSDYGNWQRLFVERKDGNGAIMPGDTIFLRTHTGKVVHVKGETVEARWNDRGDWQTLVIEKSATRRLTQNSTKTLMFV